LRSEAYIHEGLAPVLLNTATCARGGGVSGLICVGGVKSG